MIVESTAHQTVQSTHPCRYAVPGHLAGQTLS
jgi:hypothetical protein